MNGQSQWACTSSLVPGDDLGEKLNSLPERENKSEHTLKTRSRASQRAVVSLMAGWRGQPHCCNSPGCSPVKARPGRDRTTLVHYCELQKYRTTAAAVSQLSQSGAGPGELYCRTRGEQIKASGRALVRGGSAGVSYLDGANTSPHCCIPAMPSGPTSRGLS